MLDSSYLKGGPIPIPLREHRPPGFLVMLAGLLMAAAGNAQGGRTAAPQKQDNAADLYALALAELDRNLKADKVKIPQPAAQVRPRGVLILRIPRAEPQPFGPEWDEPIQGSVVARALFAQAAARPSCRFASASPAAETARTARLKMLSRLVAVHGLQQAATRPDAVCTDAFTLLRHSRHMYAGACNQQVTDVMKLEQTALRLLREALDSLKRDPAHNALLTRCRTELATHRKQRITVRQMVDVLHNDVPLLLDLHESRLRDMHETGGTGFDRQVMQKLVIEFVEQTVAAVAEEQPITATAWAKQVKQNKHSMLLPAKGAASITEKASRGLALLVLFGAERMLAVNKSSLEAMAACQRQLREPGRQR